MLFASDVSPVFRSISQGTHWSSLRHLNERRAHCSCYYYHCYFRPRVGNWSKCLCWLLFLISTTFRQTPNWLERIWPIQQMRSGAGLQFIFIFIYINKGLWSNGSSSISLTRFLLLFLGDRHDERASQRWRDGRIPPETSEDNNKTKSCSHSESLNHFFVSVFVLCFILHSPPRKRRPSWLELSADVFSLTLYTNFAL